MLVSVIYAALYISVVTNQQDKKYRAILDHQNRIVEDSRRDTILTNHIPLAYV